jgi:zinc transport system substrate-binding protein
MKKILLLLSMLVIAVTLTACNRNDTEDTNVIYVTLYPMEFLIKEIAGDHVTVRYVPGGANHADSFDPGAQDMIGMLEADLLFYVHGGADNFIPLNASLFDEGDVELVDMSQHVTYNLVCYQHSHDHEEDTEDTQATETCDTGLSEDPHFWLDPVLMSDAALFVKDKLIATYPDQEEIFNNNYTVLSASLEKLHEDFEEMALAATKPIITTVMLFTYWHERYDLEIMPITSDAHSTESNPGDLIELLNHALEDDIMYVLFEKNANSPAGTQLLSDLQAQVPEAESLYLHGLGKLTEEEIDAGATYLTIMRNNLEVLNTATK